jgi:hypothetical protein
LKSKLGCPITNFLFKKIIVILAIDQPKQVNANDFSWLIYHKPRKFVIKD